MGIIDTDVVLPPPSAAPSALPADWVRDRYQWGGPWVTSEVGPGFDAYVRVFHPYGEEDGAQTWAEVAAAHGKTMHPAAQWDEITCEGAWNPSVEAHPNNNGRSSLVGDLPKTVLAALCRVLRRHTATPEDCYFGVWDGWGWDNSTSVVFVKDGGPTPLPRLVSAVRLDPLAPRFSVPARDFLLYSGVVEQALTIGGGDYHDGHGFFWEQSPTLMWPADHAWCLSTEIDADYTIIGGSRAFVEELAKTAGVEALEVAPDEPLISGINQ